MPESAIKFGSYEGSKRAFAKLEGHNDPRAINPWSKFMAGGMGGMISQYACRSQRRYLLHPKLTILQILRLPDRHPEVVSHFSPRCIISHVSCADHHSRMQCETVPHGLYGNRLILATFLQMWRSNGIHPFYRGLPMGLVGMFPYAAIDLSTFEYLKRTIASRNAKRRGCHEEDAGPGSFMTAGIGALSGALGASVVYPLNVLRTRLQAQGTKLHPQTYTGMIDVAQKTLSREGVKGLFRGITPNLLKVVPAVSIVRDLTRATSIRHANHPIDIRRLRKLQTRARPPIVHGSILLEKYHYIPDGTFLSIKLQVKTEIVARRVVNFAALTLLRQVICCRQSN